MKSIITILSSLLSLSTFAFDSGEKYRCYNDSSLEIIELEITNLASKQGVVRFTNTPELRDYSNTQLVIEVASKGATFLMLDKNGKQVERIIISSSASRNGYGPGIYKGASESFPIDCWKNN